MGGRRPLDKKAAEDAIDRLADTMKISRITAAAGAYRLVNLKMADGIRLMTVRRGLDPRRFALLSFGGAAGLHAVEVARELQIKRVIVPTTASVMSAWGLLTSDLRYEVSGTYLNTQTGMNADEIRAFYSDLEAAATTRMRSWFDGSMTIEQSAEMRYGEQIFEVDVPLSDVAWASEDLADQLSRQFHRKHKELYTYALPGEEVVLVNGRVSAVGVLPHRDDIPRSKAGRTVTPHGMRDAYFKSWQHVPVYSFGELPANCKIEGPAILQAETTTVIANANDCVTVNEHGWLNISVGEPVAAHHCAVSAETQLDALAHSV
jgi:N-methylhydantoinase A